MTVASHRWLALTVLFVVRTAMAFQFQTIGSVGPLLIDALHIDYAMLGTLIGFYLLPGAAIALPGGVLGQRFGDKRLALVGLALMTAGGALTGLADTLLPVAAGRLISGTGAVLINIMLTKMIVDWFTGAELATAMGLLITSWPLGLAVALMFYAPLASATSWHAVMAVGAAISLAGLILMALLYRDPPAPRRADEATFAITLDRREWVLVSIAGFVWSTYNVAYIVLVSFSADLFRARGYGLAEAAGIASFLGWGLILSVPLGGYLAERWDRRTLVMVAGFLVAAAAACAMAFAADPVPAFGIVVVMIGAPAGLIMALPAQVLRPENRSAGMGVYYTCYYIGMAVLPGIAGLARDVSGRSGAPVLFAGVMLVVSLLGLCGFLWARQDRTGPSRT